MNKCADVMTKEIKYCLPQSTVEEVAQLMKRMDVGPVPIVDNKQNKKLVGIVTDRDLVLKVLAEGRNSKNTKVEEVMTKNPVTCKQDYPMENILGLMEEHQVRRIPVVEDDNKLIGIISEGDVATRLKEPFKTGEVVEAISQPKSPLPR